jgi:hypothetical protein
LKDAAVVFFLVLSIITSIRLNEKWSVKHVAILIVALFSILSLRFYVFYMIAVAIGGAFVIGLQKITPTNFARQFAVLILVGMSLMYLGVTRYASGQFERFGTLEAVQRSRADLSRAGSGFGRDVDVSTTEGAISTIPVGLIYLLFAPFPWQLASLRQSITLPEMIITGARHLVFTQVPATPNLTGSDFHHDAFARLLGVSGQCGHGLPPARAVAGVLFCVCRGRFCFTKREERKPRQAAASQTLSHKKQKHSGWFCTSCASLWLNIRHLKPCVEL